MYGSHHVDLSRLCLLPGAFAASASRRYLTRSFSPAEMLRPAIEHAAHTVCTVFGVVSRRSTCCGVSQETERLMLYGCQLTQSKCVMRKEPPEGAGGGGGGHRMCKYTHEYMIVET